MAQEFRARVNHGNQPPPLKGYTEVLQQPHHPDLPNPGLQIQEVVIRLEDQLLLGVVATRLEALQLLVAEATRLEVLQLLVAEVQQLLVEVVTEPAVQGTEEAIPEVD